jgi:two-component system, sensor histidine kinase PdtaS
MFVCLTGHGQTQLDSLTILNQIQELEDYMWVNCAEGTRKAKSLQEAAIQLGNNHCIAQASRLHGKFLWADGYYDMGLHCFRQAIYHSRLTNDLKTMASSLDLIGNTFYYQAYYDSAVSYFTKALNVYQSVNDLQGMITVHHNISLMYHRQGNFRKTIEHLFQEEALKDRLPNSQHEIEAFGAMSGLMVDSLYYLEEIQDELKSLSRFLVEGEKKSIYRTYRNIGKAYEQLNQYVLAARWQIKSCQLMEELGLIPEWDVVALNYRYANMPDSCVYYHYKSRQYFGRHTRPNISYSLELLGDAYLTFNKPDSALYYYKIALEQNYVMNNRITITGIHRSMVNAYRQIGKYNEAETNLNIGLKQAKEVALIHERNLLSEGKRLYQELGNFTQAFKLAEQLTKIQDSIYKSETLINLTRLQAEFKTAKRTREVEELQHLNNLKQVQLDARRFQIIIGVLLLVLITFVSGFYFYRYQQKRRASDLLTKQNRLIESHNEKLTNQNKEKEIILSELHHRVKNNLQIISSLINLKSNQVSAEAAAALQQLNGRVFSMGLIHDKLYKTENIQLVRLDSYLGELCKYLIDSFNSHENPVILKFQAESIELDADKTLSCGLICNEVITNSLKHAFEIDQHNREIAVTLNSTPNDIELVIKDNGSTFNEVTPTSSHSFGIRFVNQLVRSKLSGQWVMTSKNGMSTKITFPKA